MTRGFAACATSLFTDRLPAAPRAGRTGIIIAILEAVMTLGNLYYCIRCLLGADNGWAKLVGFCSEHLKTILFTGDIPAWAALLYAVITMSSLIEKLGGERLKRSRQRRIFKAKQEGGIADADVWLCECGFVNKRIDSECVSCGRYKPLPERTTVQRERG